MGWGGEGGGALESTGHAVIGLNWRSMAVWNWGAIDEIGREREGGERERGGVRERHTERARERERV